MHYAYLLFQLILILSINIIVLFFSIITNDLIVNIIALTLYSILLIPIITTLIKLKSLLEFNDSFDNFLYCIIEFSLFIEIIIGVFLFIELMILLFFS